MKILYGVNTNGQGHINRARSIIRQFQADGNQVDVVFSGPKPPAYAKQLSDRNIHVPGWELAYNSRKLDILRTFLKNIPIAANLPHRIKYFIQLVKKQQYELIITDFDIFTSLTGWLTKTPTISIDHQHSLIHPSAEVPEKLTFDKLATLYSVIMASPFKHYYVALDYTNTVEETEKGMLHPMIWKDELSDYTIKDDGHILIYLSTYEKKELIRFFSKYSTQKFIIYGYDEERTYRNIELKETSRENFLTDLTSSKGIIGHAGFSLTWEAILLNKKLWVIPQKHQYEQVVNAFRIKKRNLGIVSENLDIDNYNRFQEFLNQPHRIEMNHKPTKSLVNVIYHKLNEIRVMFS